MENTNKKAEEVLEATIVGDNFKKEDEVKVEKSQAEILADKFIERVKKGEGQAKASDIVSNEKMSLVLNKRSEILDKSVSEYAKSGDNCRTLTDDLKELALLSDEFSNKLNPKKFLGIIPVKPKPLRQLMQNFGSTNNMMNGIVTNLEKHKITLENDNDQIRLDIMDLKEISDDMREGHELLNDVIAILKEKGKELDGVDKDVFSRRLFDLTNENLGIAEQIAITENSISTMGMNIENNERFVFAIKRSSTVTQVALKQALMLNDSLDKQEKAEQAITATNAAVNKILAETTKGVQKHAERSQHLMTSATVDREVLKKSFKDLADVAQKNIEFSKTMLNKMEKEADEFKVILEDSKKIATLVTDGLQEGK